MKYWRKLKVYKLKIIHFLYISSAKYISTPPYSLASACITVSVNVTSACSV